MTKQPKKVTNKEALLALAREALSRGVSVSVVFDTLFAGEGDVPPPPDIPEADWTKVKRVCAKCHVEKVVMPDFGLAKHRGVVRPQSYCKQCRANGNYHARPRVYATKTSGPRTSKT